MATSFANFASVASTMVLHQHPPFSDVQAEIRACTKCQQKRFLREARPIFSGHDGQQLMLIGQSPSLQAHETDIPWAGRSAAILTEWVSLAGFDGDRLFDDWYMTSLTKCFPGKNKVGYGDRVPTRREMRWCSPHLHHELDYVQPQIIVTLGKLASSLFITDAHRMTLTELVGSVFHANIGYGDMTIVPLPHPSGVSRWLNSDAHKEQVIHALQRLNDERIRRGL